MNLLSDMEYSYSSPSAQPMNMLPPYFTIDLALSEAAAAGSVSEKQPELMSKTNILSDVPTSSRSPDISSKA